MASIAASRMNLLKGLVKTLPAASLRSLETALGMTHDAPLSEVRALVTAEIVARHLRDSVFLPFLPLFEARDDGLDAMRFPSWLLSRLWSRLEQDEAQLCLEAGHALRVLRTEDPTPVPFFRLIKAAADLCRAVPQEIAPGGVEVDLLTVSEFACYLDLHRLIRQTLPRLPDFLGRMDAEKAATLRVMFGDASLLDPASGYRYLELIFANLDDGAQIIKFVATVSDRPKDRFLAESEMAVFGERILDQIEARIEVLKRDMGNRHKVCENLDRAGEQVAQAFGQLQAFEHYIELSRDGLWGKRVMEARKHLAGLVEQQLNGAESLLEQALVIKTERQGRIKREMPDLERLPGMAQDKRIRQTLDFIGKARAIANTGGFATLHTKVVRALETYMDVWFVGLLSLASSDEPVDMQLVTQGFDLVTGLMALLCGEEKAQTARRRVASCERLKPARSVA